MISPSANTHCITAVVVLCLTIVIGTPAIYIASQEKRTSVIIARSYADCTSFEIRVIALSLIVGAPTEDIAALEQHTSESTTSRESWGSVVTRTAVTYALSILAMVTPRPAIRVVAGCAVLDRCVGALASLGNAFIVRASIVIVTVLWGACYAHAIVALVV
jgi:hypothetical protein